MGKRVRWQFLLAFLGLVLLIGLLSAYAYSYTTVVVPDHGGNYVEGIAGFPQYVNPLFSRYNSVDSDLSALIFSGLTRMDERGNILPDLAKRWEISSNGLLYTFHLNPNRRWQDGVPVTSADVLYTVRVMQDPNYPGPPDLHDLWSRVEAKTPDQYTIQFSLKTPYAPFLDYTTQGIIPAHLWEHVPVTAMLTSRLNIHPVGTGPWKLAKIDAGEAILKPNPTYPWAKHPPYLDSVTLKFYPDKGSVLTAYARKEVDGIAEIPAEYIGKASEMQDLQMFLPPIDQESLVLLNLRDPTLPFFQRKEVRQALLYALDRETLVKEVLRGYGLVIHSPILPDNWAYDPDVPHYGYDPAKAQELLEAAGWADTDGDGIRDRDGKPLQFILLTDDDPPHVALAEKMSEYWKAVGVKAVPQHVGFPQMVSDYLYPHNFDAILLSWSLVGDPDPYPLWHSTQYARGQNFGGWSNRLADEAMEQARMTLNTAARARLYATFQQTFAEEVPALLLYQKVYGYGVRNTIKGVRVGPLAYPSDRFRTLADWYIYSKRVPTNKLRRGK